MFNQDFWPRRCGFVWNVRTRRWERGDSYLRKDDAKQWTLFRGPDDSTGTRILTLCRTRDGIEVDLSLRLRDLMGGQPA